MEGLAQAAEHADRAIPLKNYCTGLLLPGERKSVEPMAARLAPDNVRRMHQSLHHVVADAGWSDEDVLRQVRDSVLPAMQKHGAIVCWIVLELKHLRCIWWEYCDCLSCCVSNKLCGCEKFRWQLWV